MGFETRLLPVGMAGHIFRLNIAPMGFETMFLQPHFHPTSRLNIAPMGFETPLLSNASERLLGFEYRPYGV